MLSFLNIKYEYNTKVQIKDKSFQIDFKTTAGWRVEGHVPDEDLRNAVRFLVEKGIMIIKK